MPEELKPVKKPMAKQVEEESKPSPGPSSSADDSKLWGALAYIGVIIIPFVGILVPLYMIFDKEKRQDKFAVFHAWQSLIITVICFFYYGALAVGVAVLSMLLGPLACIMIPLYAIPLVVILFVAYKAYQGEKFMLPVICDFADKQVK